MSTECGLKNSNIWNQIIGFRVYQQYGNSRLHRLIERHTIARKKARKKINANWAKLWQRKKPSDDRSLKEYRCDRKGVGNKDIRKNFLGHKEKK